MQGGSIRVERASVGRMFGVSGGGNVDQMGEGYTDVSSLGLPTTGHGGEHFRVMGSGGMVNGCLPTLLLE